MRTNNERVTDSCLKRQEAGTGGGTRYSQKLEAGPNGCTNTLTSVAKDNYVCEKECFCLQYVRNEYGRMIRKGYESGDIKARRSEIRDVLPRTDGITNTITTILKDNIIMEKELMPEPVEARPKGKGWKWIPEEMCWVRLRKLTPKECFRLMDMMDECIGKIQTAVFPDKKSVIPVGYGVPDSELKQVRISDSQQYKMAGNSIVVACLEGIFNNLFTNGEVEKETLF